MNFRSRGWEASCWLQGKERRCIVRWTLALGYRSQPRQSRRFSFSPRRRRCDSL